MMDGRKEWKNEGRKGIERKRERRKQKQWRILGYININKNFVHSRKKMMFALGPNHEAEIRRATV